jgi:phosphatidylglycerol:prolipoprotein diacylglycerol transferase
MRQELFRIPIPDWVPFLGTELPLFGYGLMLVLGFYAGMQLMRVLARRRGLNPDLFVNVAIVALIFGVIGARLSHVLENIGDYTSPDRSAWANFLDAINIRSGGLTFFGGLLLATPACIAYGIWNKIPLRSGMDVVAPAVMLALCFGRIGCFLNGCCYGAECNLPWAVSFPYHSNAYVDQVDKRRLDPGVLRITLANGDQRLVKPDELKEAPELAAIVEKGEVGVSRSLPVHPSQLYSAFNALLISAALVAFFTLRPTPGRVFALMLILKGITRFILEMLRTEPTVLGPLSFSMVISIFLVIGGVIMWHVVGRMGPERRRPDADDANAEKPGRVAVPA